MRANDILHWISELFSISHSEHFLSGEEESTACSEGMSGGKKLRSHKGSAQSAICADAPNVATASLSRP